MPSIIELTRITPAAAAADPWLQAVASDYSTPDDPAVFVGTGLDGERIAIWIGEDGGGFGCIDARPDQYVAASAAMAAVAHLPKDAPERLAAFAPMAQHGGVDEYEFDEGSFKYRAKRLWVPASLTFGV